MTSTVRRSGAFAAVGLLSFAVLPVVETEMMALATVVAAGPFLAVAAFALTVSRENPLFDLFASPTDHRDGSLYGLAGFALAGAGLAILAVGFDMPAGVHVASVLVVGVGTLAGQSVRWLTGRDLLAIAGFVAGGALAAGFGQVLVTVGVGESIDGATVLFLATSGALAAALLREWLFRQDDALVMVSVGLLLWFLATLPADISTTRILVALGVTVVLGYASVELETASVAGMLTGVLLALLTIVLGDYGWFVMLVAFFGIGGLAAKFRYDQKVKRGIAEDNEGARGTGNVLANSVVALLAVLGSPLAGDLGVDEALFFFAFAGAVAAALADTLSSEIGGLFDRPRLITTFELVPPGTDGGVTWQGELAGVLGAAVIAAIALGFGHVTLAGAGLVVAAGVVGMTVDSLLGATIEGRVCGNQGVNFLATVAAAITGGGLARWMGVGLVG